MARKSGVLLHISSLPGEYGIGTLGKDARRFVDFLKRCGFTYWQILPLCMTNSYHSPYQSPASFSGNPFFIDLEALSTKNLLTDEELLSAKQTTSYSCEFARLKEDRLALLHRAYERSDKAVTQESIQKTPALQKLCRFLALQAANDGKPWQEWTVQEPKDLGFYEFLQVTFFQQWAELRNYANERGIRIIGDLPIYVDIDSADVPFLRHGHESAITNFLHLHSRQPGHSQQIEQNHNGHNNHIIVDQWLFRLFYFVHTRFPFL